MESDIVIILRERSWGKGCAEPIQAKPVRHRSRESHAARGNTGWRFSQDMARILLVEDEMLVRELAREDLSDAGFEVIGVAA